jgi:hypothetical protein
MKIGTDIFSFKQSQFKSFVCNANLIPTHFSWDQTTFSAAITCLYLCFHFVAGDLFTLINSRFKMPISREHSELHNALTRALFGPRLVGWSVCSL